MRAYGNIRRTYHNCRVYQAGHGKKIRFTVGVKNRKAERTQAIPHESSAA